MKQLTNIDGKWYILLGMYVGQFYATNLFDLNNEVAELGVIVVNQLFCYANEKGSGRILRKIINHIRVLKQFFVGDTFGKRFTR